MVGFGAVGVLEQEIGTKEYWPNRKNRGRGAVSDAGFFDDTVGGLEDMARSDLGSILKRIDKRLVVVELSDRAASKMSGMSGDAIRTMRRQWQNYKENLPGPKQKTATTHTLGKLARPLQTTMEWLMNESGPESIDEVREQRQRAREAKETSRETKKAAREAKDVGSVEKVRGAATVPVVAEVAAGTWRECAVLENDIRIEVPAAPGYPVNLQHAAIVRGNSINRVANSGDFLIILNATESGVTPRHGDLVVVIRKNKGGLYEASAKRYHLAPDEKAVELRYDSADPQYGDRVALSIPMLPTGGAAEHAEDGTEITVKGIVLAVYRLPQ